MKPRTTEYVVAVGSFIAAVAFAFTSMALAEGHEVAAGNCTVIAQFLLLTASIFGIDYKMNEINLIKHGNNKESNQPGDSSG